MATGVQISGKIKPLATAVPAYPVFEDTDGQGGWRSVADITARDVILPSFRKEGMIVWVESETLAYQLQGGITNADWVLYGSSALSNAFFVDGGAFINGNGSIAMPFNTLAAAIAAGDASPHPAISIYLTQYDYTGEGTLATGAGVKYSFIGMGSGTDLSNTHIPDIQAGGDCYFQNCFVGHLSGLSITQDGSTEVFFNNASAFGVTGKVGQQLNLYVTGISTTLDPNNVNSTINGPITNCTVCVFNGATCVASGDTCSIVELNLRNGSVFTAGALESSNVGVFESSYLTTNTLTGDSTGKVVVENSHFGSSGSGVTGFLATSSFRGTIFEGSTFLDFATATSCQMDADSYYSLFSAGGNTNAEIISLTAGEPSCRAPITDGDSFIFMSGQGKVVIPAGVLTAAHHTQLQSSDSVDKQLIIFDSFAHEGFAYQVLDGATAAVLYTFGNSALHPSSWRATFVVLSFAGNSFGLFSVEPIIWNTP